MFPFSEAKQLRQLNPVRFTKALPGHKMDGIHFSDTGTKTMPHPASWINVNYWTNSVNDLNLDLPVEVIDVHVCDWDVSHLWISLN